MKGLGYAYVLALAGCAGTGTPIGDDDSCAATCTTTGALPEGRSTGNGSPDRDTTSGGTSSPTASGGPTPGDTEGSTTGAPDDPGHPDGLDPWLPDLEPDACPIAHTLRDAIDETRLQARTVCATGCDHTTLTEALDAAQPYDEILLAPGDYDECVSVDVSPLVIRGDGGRARFVDVGCEPGGDVFALHGADVRLSSLEINGYAGRAIQLGTEVQQAVLERLWIENTDDAVGGPADELVLRQVKIKNVGWYNASIEHQASILPVTPNTLVVDRSVFSHYKERAWLLGAHGVSHIEFVCSVIAKVGGPDLEADHSLHVFYPSQILLTHNYLQEFGRIYNYIYNYDAPAAEIHMVGNEFVLDHEAGDFVGNLQPSTVITAIDNTVIGGAGADALNSYPQGEVSGNVYIPDRETAGIRPYPALPATWPVTQL